MLLVQVQVQVQLKLRLLMQVPTAGRVTTTSRVTTVVEVTTDDNDCAKDKTGLGYNYQMNKSDLNDVHVNESQVIGNSLIDSHESDGEDNQISDSKDENVVEKTEVKKTVKPSLEKIEFVNARNATIKNESKTKKPRKLRQSPRVPVNAAKQSSYRAATSASAARHVNTVSPKPYSPVRRSFNKKSAAKTNNFYEKVNTAKVNKLTTGGTKAVVSAAEEKRNNIDLVEPFTDVYVTLAHTKKVGDEAVYIGEDDRVVRAATIATSLEAEQKRGSGPRCQDTTLGDAAAQTRRKSFDKENVSKQRRNLKTRPMFEESDFVSIESEVVKDSGKKDESSSKHSGKKDESSSKQAGSRKKRPDDTLASINMLVEKKYPLTKEMLARMLNLRLEADLESCQLELRLLMQVSTVGSVTTALRVTTAVEVTTDDNDWSKITTTLLVKDHDYIYCR
nr:hypothetical protein [Tanacetum cinerariifolium]